MLRRPLFLFALAGAAGCGGDAPRAAAFTTRDSAGAVIAESAGPAWEARDGWVVQPEPVLVAGGAGKGPAHELYRVRDALLLEDGRIAVANEGSAEVRIFDAEGGHLVSVGREGAGPGEFQTVSGLHRYRGDSILVWDRRQGRATVLDPSGEYARVITPRTNATSSQLAGVLPDGSFVVASVWRGAIAEGERIEAELPLVRYDSTGMLLDSIARYPYTTLVRVGFAIAPLWFGASTDAVLRHGRLYVATGRRPEVEVLSPEGELLRVTRWREEPEAITEEAIRDWEARQLEASEPEERPATRRFHETLRYAPMNAFNRGILVDAEGNLWVEPAPGPYDEPPLPWMVFDPRGRWLGPVSFPPGFRVLDIGSEEVLGLVFDDLGAPSVRLLRLKKSPG